LNDHVSKALALLSVSRHDLAEAELRAALAADPGDARAHAVLSLVLSQLDRTKQALEEAERAVGLAPDLAFCHYARAAALGGAKKMTEASRAAEEAIRLEPEDADYHGQLASIRLAQERWADALAAAERGLGLDAEHEDCLGFRAVALASLGRTAEAEDASRQALTVSPASAEIHATRGWTLLQAGRGGEALESFREALRLNPNLERARRGIVEALKARSLPYRAVLRYMFWMHRIGQRGRWAFLIGLVIGIQVFSRAADRIPWLAAARMPVLVAYIAFAVLTWVAVPFANLLLMLNRFGRLSLQPEERRASLALGCCLAAALSGFAAGGWTGNFPLQMLGFLGLTMAIPAVATLKAETPRSRMILGAYSLGLLAAGAAAILMCALRAGPLLVMVHVYMIGWVAFSWLANLIRERE
jgi:tetratricopeptide (TPR) repeat protein